MSVAISDAGGDYGAVIVSGANLLRDAAAVAGPDLWQGARVLILQNEMPRSHQHRIRACCKSCRSDRLRQRRALSSFVG